MLKKIFSSIIVLALSLLPSLVTEAAERRSSIDADSRGRQERFFSHLRPQHKAVLVRWLKKMSGLRPATEADCTDTESLRIWRKDWGKDFHPYYSVADFNRDGREDFAVLLVDRKKEDGVAIAIFNSPFEKKTRPNYFERGYEGIGRLYIVYHRVVERRLYLGVYESDFYCVTFYPKGRRYVYKDCLP